MRTATVDAFMAFYDTTCDAAYRLACCLTRDVTSAADAVTRAYVRAYCSEERPGPGRQGRALILGLVREEAVSATPGLLQVRHRQLQAS